MRTTTAVAALVASASALPHIKRQSSYGNGTASVSNPAVWESLRGKIKHVVYLMEENHSFDNVSKWKGKPIFETSDGC